MKDQEMLDLLEQITNADASTDEYMLIIVKTIRAYCEEKIHLQRLEQDDSQVIQCPRCDALHTVYHFQWEAITCNKCQEMIAKKHWKLYQDNPFEMPEATESKYGEH